MYVDDHILLNTTAMNRAMFLKFSPIICCAKKSGRPKIATERQIAHCLSKADPRLNAVCLNPK